MVDHRAVGEEYLLLHRTPCCTCRYSTTLFHWAPNRCYHLVPRPHTHDPDLAAVELEKCHDGW